MRAVLTDCDASNTTRVPSSFQKAMVACGSMALWL